MLTYIKVFFTDFILCLQENWCYMYIYIYIYYEKKSNFIEDITAVQIGNKQAKALILEVSDRYWN